MSYRNQEAPLKKRFDFLACFVFLGFFVAFATLGGLAGNAPTYTGKYSPLDKKAVSGSGEVTLEVVQSGNSIQVTLIQQGKRTTNRYPLDGSEGDYMTASGIHGRCKGQAKGKQLILESLVTVQPPGSARPIREHTRQRWQLSPEAKTLTIQTDVDFPDFPVDISAAVAGDTSDKEKYIRVEDR